MKSKLFFLILTLAIASGNVSNCFSQENQHSLRTIVDPAKNRGYLKWQNDNSENYRVDIYEKQGSNMVLISSKTTGDNYIQMQPLLFSLPNLYFQISSVDNNGTVISQGELTPNALPTGVFSTGTILCDKVCNGRSYAWKLTAYEPEPGSGINKWVQLSSAYQLYNIEEGYYIPYWQGVSAQYYAHLNTINHPYRRYAGTYGTGNPLYMIEQINPDIQATYYDKDNFPVSSGYIIEKKLDQFAMLNNNSTIGTAWVDNLCSNPITGVGMSWVNFFNMYKDPNHSATPIVPDWQNYFEATDNLACNPSQARPNKGRDSIAWQNNLSRVHKFWKCIRTDHYSSSSFLKCFDDYLPGFAGVIINSIGDSTVNIRLKNAIKNDSVGSYYAISPAILPKIKKGLYKVSFFDFDGNVFSTVAEFNASEEAKKPLKDNSKLTIKPNPIINKNINLEVTSKSNEKKALRIYDMYGNILYTEDTNELDIDRVIDVSSSNSMIFIVSVIFQDGSVLQEFVLSE